MACPSSSPCCQPAHRQGQRQTDIFSRVFTQFTPESPQLKIDVNRDRLAALDVDYGQAMQTFSFYFGGAYINDTFQEGKVRRVYVQADAPFRATPQQLRSLFVSNRTGEPIPLAEVFTVSPCHRPLGDSPLQSLSLDQDGRITWPRTKFRPGHQGYAGDLLRSSTSMVSASTGPASPARK